jgi:MurNAc alpha-1-phosphate uridylyltransferase
MIAMILAAGRGERLRPVTDTMPKPLVEVGGVSLLERHLKALAKSGVSTVIINLGWLGEQIAERIGSGSKFGLQVCYSPEYDQILETGGGIRRALPMLGSEPFWVLNSDTYTDFLIPDVALADDCLGHLVLVPTPKDKSNGDFDLVDGRIRNADKPRFTFSGFACYRPEFFAGCAVERFSVVPLLRKAADLGHLSGETYTGKWVDVGTPQKLSDINNAS